MPPWATPGVARSFFHGWIAASPTTKTSGWPGDRQVRPDAHPAVAVRLGAGRGGHLAPERRGQHARGPEHGTGVDLLGLARRRLHADQAVLDVHDLGLRAHDHAAASRAGAAPRPSARAGRSRSTRSIASTSTIRASCGLIDRKSLRSVSWAISPSAPASSTPVGPPPIEHERHPRLALDGIGLALGGLERDQDPAPDLRRVVDGLEARARTAPSRRARSRRGGHRSRRSACRRAPGRRPTAGPRASRRRCRSPRPAARSCCAACGRSSAAAARSRPATARRSRPGTASAGTGGGSVGRSA